MEKFIEVHEVGKIYYSQDELEQAVRNLYYDHFILCDEPLRFDTFEQIITMFFKERLIKENFNCEHLNKEITDHAQRVVDSIYT